MILIDLINDVFSIAKWLKRKSNYMLLTISEKKKEKFVTVRLRFFFPIQFTETPSTTFFKKNRDFFQRPVLHFVFEFD